jgi:Cu/Ag efflux pump CusA
MTPASRLLSSLRAAGCHPVLDRLQQVTFPQGHPAGMGPDIAKLGNELREALQKETKEELTNRAEVTPV